MPPSLSVTGPTPEASPQTPTRNKGKRKAEEVEGADGTPPDQRKAAQKTTFAVESPRPHRASGTTTSSHSHAPSSYHRQKRARLSAASTSGSASIAGAMSVLGEDQPSSSYGPNAANTGSWTSRASIKRSLSRTSGRGSHRHSPNHRPPSVARSQRNSLSQASIPISALISPHAPSVSNRSSTYHSRDPRRPPPVQGTPWSLNLPEKGWKQNGTRWIDAGGSPRHAWLFFIGFVLFPLWWLAAFLPIPRTRHIGAGEMEKGVVLDDPQVEHDALSWRFRCRIMAAVSLLTYVPFIVCIAVFAPR
ncbi:hypothetical protein CYLTODRAFT_345542 [Cylindrobasidium torrendii FP15055 ss-10]|uniref:Uncharacterized protein n=1 Tax=Cylindrobasidium torrendii FP15055 ss-10 TaxID=1314674 RepID=A0A0D7BN66_9AGAR|nr:hypothetical protein CYLTODRAFT_345542 [Cylindrobasidium torrendii FP15055 ss-10]